MSAHLYQAVKILDPKLQDGVHEWHGGRNIVKEGDRIYLEGTAILAGRRVHYFDFSSPLLGRVTQSKTIIQCRQSR